MKDHFIALNSSYSSISLVNYICVVNHISIYMINASHQIKLEGNQNNFKLKPKQSTRLKNMQTFSYYETSLNNSKKLQKI